MEQKNANGFSPHAGNQFALDRLFSHQAHRPAGAARGRVTADHGDYTLLLATVQHLGRAWPLLLIEGAIQAPFLITVSDLANRLGCHWDNTGDAGRADPLG